MAQVETEVGTVHYLHAAAAHDPVGTVAFVSDAGVGPWFWGWQQPVLAQRFDTVVWDLPGTGDSTLADRYAVPDGDPASATLSVEALADALEMVLSATATARVHLVGVGLGGMVALAHARQYDRTRRLALVGTAKRGDRVDDAALAAAFLPAGADREDCGAALRPLVSDGFVAENQSMIEQVCGWRASEDAGRAAWAAHAGAMLDFESGPLYELTLPTAVFHGQADPIVPASAGEALAEDLPRGEFVPCEGRHLPTIEHARAVSDRIEGFLLADAGEQGG